MCNSKISKLEEEQHNMKLKMTEMMNLLKEHLVGGKVTPSEGQSRNVPQSNNIQSPKSIALEKRHNFTEGKNACYLLDWADAIVAEGRWDSSDPNITVHGKPLGPDFMRVWVDVAIVPESYLFRPNHAMLTIQEAVGSTVVLM
ncbi:uncharacterized protein LOC133833166 [Humulus lupulus]|uniref:uncharacterized protein LOC133833166 n=1 Tax=Humulus lupulus TaxID=3486 RepID=UPI002B40489B|nr:uncharacterized protein LOC133833166 [Humulus lupulus]